MNDDIKTDCRSFHHPFYYVPVDYFFMHFWMIGMCDEEMSSFEYYMLSLKREENGVKNLCGKNTWIVCYDLREKISDTFSFI